MTTCPGCARWERYFLQLRLAWARATGNTRTAALHWPTRQPLLIPAQPKEAPHGAD